jgi:branched-chain amino acid transport system permease protein
VPASIRLIREGAERQWDRVDNEGRGTARTNPAITPRRGWMLTNEGFRVVVQGGEAVAKFVALLGSGVAYGAILTLVALGFVVLYKATGIINFAHGDLVTLGAYVAYWAGTSLGLPILLTYLVSIVLLFACGVVVERIAYVPLRRRPPLVVVIATLAVAVMIEGLIALWQGSTPKALPSPVGDSIWHVAGANISFQRVLIVVVSGVVVAGVLLVFQRTSIGRQVRALANDGETAMLYGVRTRAVSLGAFGVSASLAALAGVLIAPTSNIDVTFGFALMVNAFAAVVLGGLESLRGTVLAALGIGIVQQVLGGYFLPNYADSLPLIVLFVVIALRPQGVVSLARSRL